ncbi:MAG: GspE/PulE family protein [Bacteroidetes bacterium]|nr:GspE/PulE family protein [Bacteroidota bacterium]MBU1114217.1 GspE/PulE family protein [Bacteroidota bacterium]MBU1797026.1 GspE/PulE family protein [Bacteroidota bacterium]
MLDSIQISHEVKSILSPKFAFAHNVLPIDIKNFTLHLAVQNQDDLKLINDVSFETGYEIRVSEFPADVILKKLKELYPNYSNNNEEIIKESLDSEQSNIEFVNQVIANAINLKASDIHFETLETAFRVRYRIDGHLSEVSNLPKQRHLSISSRLKIMANLDISEKRRPQDGRIKFIYKGHNIDIRVSSLPTGFGEKIVLRILDKSQLKLDLKLLGLSESQYKILTKTITAPYGMVLVTGPTGSGKTTTLYAALKQIHSIEKNIMTIEDPIEYNIDGINQCNVKSDIGFDFAKALRSFLRQDPNVIMVGEIRDRETAEIAIRASLTGHLVFSTLHTNDSISAITRLIDMGIEPFLISASLKLIVAQRLVRTLCSCKVLKRNLTQEKLKPHEIGYKNVGCNSCNNTGFKGRTSIFEILEVDEKITELISNNVSVTKIREAAVMQGYKILREAGMEKVRDGITTYEEVLQETML